MWSTIRQAPFDASKSASVTGLTLTHDRLKITLTDGAIQFGQPVNGHIFAAAFEGHGKLSVTPPNSEEAQQLHLFINADELNLDFTEAAFRFTDNTFYQLARQVHWSASSPGGPLELPVYAHYKGCDIRLGWLAINGKTTPLKFTLPVEVNKIMLNDNEDILA